MAIKLFLGVPGAGKSLAMQDLVYEVTKQGWPCFVIDHCFEWLNETIDGKPNVRWRGKPPFIIRAPPPGEDLSEVISDTYAKGACLVFEKFDGWEPNDVASLVKQWGNAIYVDDEIDIFAVYKDWLENPLRDFIHRGRHMPNQNNEPTQVHIFGAARRPQNLHSDLTSMADEVFLFRVQGVNTLKRCISEGYVLPENVDELKSLPDLHYFKWSSRGAIARGNLKPLSVKPIPPKMDSQKE